MIKYACILAVAAAVSVAAFPQITKGDPPRRPINSSGQSQNAGGQTQKPDRNKYNSQKRIMMADQILFVSCSTSIRQMPPMSFGQMAAKINADMSMGSTRYWMIDGHTCTSICDNGTSNDWLSWHRAAAIKSKLIAAGVPANHLKIRGFASNWIVVNPSTHPDNRRVEIYAADDAGYPLSLEQSDNMMMCPKPSDCPF